MLVYPRFISSLVAPSFFLTRCSNSTRALFFQAVCTFYLHPLGCSLRLAHIRTALSTFCTVCFVVTLITGVLARLAYKGWFVAFPLSLRVPLPHLPLPSRNFFNFLNILIIRFVSQARIPENGTGRTVDGSCTWLARSRNGCAPVHSPCTF